MRDILQELQAEDVTKEMKITFLPCDIFDLLSYDIYLLTSPAYGISLF